MGRKKSDRSALKATSPHKSPTYSRALLLFFHTCRFNFGNQISKSIAAVNGGLSGRPAKLEVCPLRPRGTFSALQYKSKSYKCSLDAQPDVLLSRLESIAATNHYSVEDVKEILATCRGLGLMVMPLVQVRISFSSASSEKIKN